MDVAAQARSRLGAVLNDKWRLDALLGAGGMAAVFAATHIRNGNRVAIKILHPHVSTDGEARARFLREGYVGNKIEHPGVVRVLDDGQTAQGETYLVLELLEGTTLDRLADHAPGGKLPLADACSFAERILMVLVAAHAVGVVHRDLKPENVFVVKDGSVKILDFGIARLRQGLDGASQTATGAMMGTPAFMSPEQALAKWDEVDARSDLFALGASLWTLLTGTLIHTAKTVPELLVKAATRQVDPIRSVLPNVPADVAAVIDRSLRFAREDRFPDAPAMLKALREAIRHNDLVVDLDATHARPSMGTQATLQSTDPGALALVTAPTLASSPTQAPVTTEMGRVKRSSRKGLALGVGAAGAAVAGVALFFALRQPDPKPAADRPSAVVDAPRASPSVAPTPAASTAPAVDTSAAPPAVTATARASTTAAGPKVPRPAGPKPSAKPKCEAWFPGCKP